ncbi:SpoIID/LytB domain-containing protein [Peptococcaceae bacterium 1198_IL3148]
MKKTLKLLLPVVIALAVLTACGGNEEKKPEQQEFKGEPTISLFINDTGEKKQIKLEEYLVGVVAAEMEPTWPENALAAQAILARTFTMENIASGRVKKLHGADASTSVEEFQAYDPSRINDNVRKAVESTRGQVIKYNGDYVKGWFAACCGGVTANAVEGLDWRKTQTPYIKAGLQDGCLEVTTPENKKWVATIPLDQVRAAVQKTVGQDPGNITTVEVAQWGPSGRAQQIKVGNVQLSGPGFRLAVGSEVMRSTLIKDIRVEGNNLVITGQGFGHGVGMCQWGANKMATEGKSPEEIVKFYYQDVTIDKLWQ